MWDLVGNPEDQFSHNEAQITLALMQVRYNLDPLGPGARTLILPGLLGTKGWDHWDCTLIDSRRNKVHI